MSEILSEAEVSMLLDLYMYTDYEYAKDNMTLGEIIKDMPNHIDVKDAYYREYTILAQAVENPQVGELKICMQSRNMGYNDGTNAVAFVNAENNNTYIVFRGTADGEWPDNGIGMTVNGTTQQKQALNYFDKVVNKLKLTEKDTVYISGHSKGGNKVQYITMESDNYKIIDACYSVDGQGHSDTAVKEWKERYSKKEYSERVDKIYGINGENDFVSPLGCGIILASHISYVKTGGSPTDFANYHDLTAMYAGNTLGDDGKLYTTYNAKRNAYALKRGEFGDFIEALSDELMQLPCDKRDGVAFSLMQSIEKLNGGRKIGINGEKAGLSDYYEFLVYGVSAIVGTVGKNGGIELLSDFLKKKSFDQRMSSSVFVRVNYNALYELAHQHISELKNIEREAGAIADLSEGVPLSYNQKTYRSQQIGNSVRNIKQISMDLRKLIDVELEAAAAYKSFDNLSMELA